jgi:hypothetical protein
MRARHVSENSAEFTVSTHDPVAQRVQKQHITVDENGFRMLPTAHRYCWPAEFDLMARLAGLRRRGANSRAYCPACSLTAM